MNRLPAVCPLFLVLTMTGGAAAASQSPASNQSNVVQATRIDSAPRIDGRLDEAVWDTITPLTDLRQFEPDNGEAATEGTEIRIAYDTEYLYFGVRAFDSDPDQIVARQFERDSFLDGDDSISIGLDSLNDDRTAYAFQTNVLGAQVDLEMTEAGVFNRAWDTIWYSAGNVDELGYTLEIAIPFFALRFQPAGEIEMGIILERIIRRKNEKANWPYLSRDYHFGTISQYARLVGLRDIRRGVDVELKPYATGGYSQVPGTEVWDGGVGLDLKWGMTTNLTTDITAHPDFAQVESDALQVNLTRFSLFFPEKRDFFLESADLFAFGLPREAEVFFSRRIGIHGNEKVPIAVGARTYGLAGQTNIGVMTMQTTSSGGVDSENFTVARVKQNVLSRSYIGGIVTNRRGADGFEDTTVGGDARFLFGVNSRIEAAVARSDRSGLGPGGWFANLAVSQRVDLYDWVVQYTDIEAAYDPGIGFVRRPDQRRFRANVHYKPRPAWSGVRQIYVGHLYERTENHNGALETQLFRPGFLLISQAEDVLTALYVDTFELVPRAFAVAPDIVIPVGEYKNRQISLDFKSNVARPWSTQVAHVQGGFYDGTLRSTTINVTAKPSPRISLTSQNRLDAVDVPAGRFESVISRFFASYFFSPTLTTRIGIQYSSLDDEFVFNSRIRWIYTPGSEAWIVYDEGRRFDIVGSSLRDRAFIVKIVHNFHF